MATANAGAVAAKCTAFTTAKFNAQLISSANRKNTRIPEY